MSEDVPGRSAPAPRRRLTARGWAMGLTGLVAWVAAFALRERELLLVAGVCIALPLLAAAWVSGRRLRLSGDLVAFPHALDIGAEGELTLTLRHRHGLPGPAAAVLLSGMETATGPVEILGGDRLELAPRPGRPRTVAIGFRGRRRGLAAVAAPSVRFCDPFFLWTEEHEPAGPASVLVLPPVVPLDGLPPGLARGRSGRVGEGQGEPGVAVRPYVAGDDLRTVHWRASARLDEDLVVRQREAGAARTVALVIDDRPASYRGSALEVAVSLTASIGTRLRQAGLPLSVADASGQVLADGQEDPEQLLVALAQVGGEPVDAAAFVPQAPGRPELVIAVLGGAPSSQDTAWLGRMAPGAGGYAFLVGDAVTPRSAALPTGWRAVEVPWPGRDEAGPSAPEPPEDARLTEVIGHAWQTAVGTRR